MKVGITVNFQFSFFSGGGSSTAISVAELFQTLGHDVWLINVNKRAEWWDDLRSLKQTFSKVVHTEDFTGGGASPPFDLVLEVHGALTKSVRAALTNTSVWVVRKSPLLHDIENSIFPITMTPRELEGLSAIWALDTEVTVDELDYLRVLGRDIPVVHVPTVWSSLPLETHRKETNLPEWLQVFAAFVQQNNALPAWSVHISETNSSASSSCTLPLVALREVKRRQKIPLTTYKVHNIDHIKKSEFFLSNVFKHCQIEDLSGAFLGRQRIIDWVFDPASVLLTHMRFRPIRPFYLDSLWFGLPIVHNSPVLRDLGGKYYYTDNSITEAASAFETLHGDLLTAQGMFRSGEQAVLRQRIADRFGVKAPQVQEGWKAALSQLKIRPAVAAAASLTVLFTDMWEDFNPSYNMFLLMMMESLRQANIKMKVTGYSPATLPADTTPDLLILGPFGMEWRDVRWAKVPKAHFTGENTQPVVESSVFLNMCFPHAEFIDERYIRLPLWMLEIDWFGCDVNKIVNPKPLPIDRCTGVYPEELGMKKRFCAFVVTNPCNPIRNNAFQWLSEYKRVDSAGRLFNNIGDEIFAGLGGGGGELKKHEFLKQYKFCLAFENASSQGYTTEKLLHAKAAGCIPIYWGDPKVERDFDVGGFLDARNVTTSDQLISLVKSIDTNNSAYLKMMSIPALDEYRRDMVRRTLREVAYKLLKGSGKCSEEQLKAIPRFIGATSTEGAAQLANERAAFYANMETADVPVPVAAEPPKPVFAPLVQLSSTSKSPVYKTKPQNPSAPIVKPLIVTYATHQYLSSVHQLLAGLTIQKKAIPDMDVQVWLAADVPAEARRLLASNYADMKFMTPPEQEAPPGFPDFWSPQHFAWKLWLYNHVNSAPENKNRLVLYLDAGIFCSRIPSDWLHLAYENGVCVLEDPRQTNDQWCHDVFKTTMKMTEAEKKSQQIVAGILAFRAGSPEADALFSEAYTLAKRRELIVGAKWEGVRNGKPFGHRHDQSILSLLSYRNGLTRYPLDNVYCDISLRKTFITGKAFYVHRGRFTIHSQFAPGMDDAYVINLDRRKDRMEKLFKHHPNFETRVERISAVEGKNLQLTPELARLFRPHDFLWKKAIMGCALSHLGLWWRLANEKPDINSYFILEDDVKLAPDWEKRWTDAAPHIPEDYDIIYLGGILPPNRQAFEANKQRVNAHFSRVAENSVFGQSPPNRYFHWCAYAYVLSKRGAEKVMKLIHAHDGYWTSADHMLCNHVEHMNLYFLDPLVAGCYQDDDPVYRTSAFNDFNRIDSFDSDLWNNDERFSITDIQNCITAGGDQPLDIRATLIQVASQQEAAAAAVEETTIGSVSSQTEYSSKLVESIQQSDSSVEQLSTEIPACWATFVEEYITNQMKGELPKKIILLKCLESWTDDSWANLQLCEWLSLFPAQLGRSVNAFDDPSPNEIRKTLSLWKQCAPPSYDGARHTLWMNILQKLIIWSELPGFVASTAPSRRKRFVSLGQHNLIGSELYEGKWLSELFGKEIPLEIDRVKITDDPPQDAPIVILQKPHLLAYDVLLQKWTAMNANYYILHLSDEFGQDSISSYSSKNCLGVIRMYQRADIPPEVRKKVKIIPLGYHYTLSGGSDNPIDKTPRLPFRNNKWSFLGTKWANRGALLEPFKTLDPHRLVLVDSWESKDKVGREEYLGILLDTYFVPCPAGNNNETFRLYEALECGCLPLYVKKDENDTYANYLIDELGLLPATSWEEARKLAQHLLDNIQLLENYRTMILNRWIDLKKTLHNDIRKLLAL